MLRKFTILLSLVLTLGFAATTSAAAQEMPDVDAPDMEGLETGYARMFMPDFGAMIDALGTPGADMPEIDQEGVLTVMTAILTFDNADNADKSMAVVADTYTEEGESDTDIDMTSEEISDLGDKATLHSGAVDISGEKTTFNILIVKDDSQLLLIQVIGGEAEAGATQAQDIANFMLDTEPTTDEVTFNEDGTSTGGAFDRMPTAEDTDLVDGLAPFIDMDMNEDAPDLGI